MLGTAIAPHRRRSPGAGGFRRRGHTRRRVTAGSAGDRGGSPGNWRSTARQLLPASAPVPKATFHSAVSQPLSTTPQPQRPSLLLVPRQLYLIISNPVPL